MKRAGFTMIELIFVIVILGILAAVAVPKLAATRDDAERSNVMATVKTSMSAVPSYVTSSKVASFQDAMEIDTNKWTLSEGDCTITYEDSVGGTISMSIFADGVDPATWAATAPKNCAQGVVFADQNETNLSMVIDYTTVAGGIVDVMVNQLDMNDTNITLGGRKVVF